MSRLTSRDLSALFASAIMVAGTTASGCGPCRVISFDYEKVVPLDELEVSPDLPLAEQCFELCGRGSGNLVSCSSVTLDGEPALACRYEVNEDCGGIGRKPPGLGLLAPSVGGRALGRHFALVAQLEAASVDAFEQLERELCAHRAPRALRRAARRAAADERRHAALTAHLARRFGVAPPPPRVEPTPLRSLEALTRDNALEGCVRETLGAAVAGWQARHADDRAIARIMQGLARDETRHAELAWALHDWARRRLPGAERRRIDDEARETAHGLRLSRETARELRELAGFPTIVEHRRMARHVARSLWGESR